MKRSDRILTTHTGSLPRPKPLAELLVAKDQGQAYDAAALAAAVRAAVLDIVAARSRPASTSSMTARCRSPAIRPISPIA